MNMKGVIRVHSLDTLGYVLKDQADPGGEFSPPGGDRDINWYKLMKATPIWEGP
jgi:hypothetical protein